MVNRTAPMVNAGSMADIAFLLLIFFLVSTTIETDKGINRKLPPLLDEPVIADIKERNLFRVEINQQNELLVEGELMKIDELKSAAIAFLDNGGGSANQGCDYCLGSKDPLSSENPGKAIVSLVNSRETNYQTYITVQNELMAAYNELRNRVSTKLYGVSFLTMEESLKDPNYVGSREELKERIRNVQSLYPEKLSEAEPRQ
ncbi:ExbD/TolR family protein [Aquimarina spongiae]|uniref:Biopolymer transport protein ExbD n=1 Tax=Aquimarina spongiae TaxID=570521 RepID=A0A1M6EDS8_9FLAO|nr:biopolymer transporter ExbD [Aquimarina spongiae]SHI83636.1 Biopolymer transport protein ExbD [Aquimarina spongiae]